MICLALRTVAALRSAPLWAIIAVSLATAATGAASALAQDIAAFTMKISEKEMKLENPSDMMWDKYLMWDLAFQRMNDRNMPYIELFNDPESTVPLTEFHLTIGDTRFNFSDKAMGKFAMLGSTTPGFELSSSTIGGFGDELVVNIGGPGLLPGEVLRFKIDLDVDPQLAGQFFAHPDYRTVLFDMNGFNVYDGLQQQSDDDNAQMWAIFQPSTGPAIATVPVAMQDEIVAGAAADFYNNNYRRYGELDPVRTFLVAGGAAGGVIPEPSSSMLAGLALFAGWLLRVRGRNQGQAS